MSFTFACSSFVPRVSSKSFLDCSLVFIQSVFSPYHPLLASFNFSSMRCEVPHCATKSDLLMKLLSLAYIFWSLSPFYLMLLFSEGSFAFTLLKVSQLRFSSVVFLGLRRLRKLVPKYSIEHPVHCQNQINVPPSVPALSWKSCPPLNLSARLLYLTPSSSKHMFIVTSSLTSDAPKAHISFGLFRHPMLGVPSF